MKKRLICAVLILTMLLALLPAQALADDPQKITGKAGKNISWTFEPVDGVLTISGEGAIPDWSYSAASPWYLYRNRIFSVTIGNKITSIGAYAFNECSKLTEINASKATISAIGDGAMNNCVLLETVSFLPGKTLTVGADAFYGCAALKKLDLGAESGSVGSGAFSGCKAMTEISLPKTMARLEQDTFYNCKALAKLNVPKGLEFIGKGCFRGCAALPNLSFPDTLKTVERYAFSGCKMSALTFAGGKPDFAPAKDASASFPAETALRFRSGAKDWTWPVCEGYETKIAYDSLDNVFTDLKKGAWYISSVQHVYYTGLMNGMSKDTFAPNGFVSRGQLVTVLYRLAGKPDVTAEVRFEDVKKKAYYYDAVRWAQSKGIVNGITKTSFAPEDQISRQQLCTILYRYAATLKLKLTQRDPLTNFTDANKIAAYAKDAMSWCVAVGLVNGKSATILDPTGNATRAEIAKILTSFDAFLNREKLTAAENWEDDILIPDVVPDINREDPAYIYARQIFDTINAKRSAGGLKAFVWNDRVYLAAQARAKEISGENCFTHTRPDGTNYSTVLTEYKVESTIRNEIIAHGYTTAQPLVDTWASTSSTSPVILALVYSQAAVGVFQAESAKEGEEGKYYYALLVIG